ncbi:hypothetical protein [Borrelia puertoricensis]|uniref:hypothetical protein n=1 Tax=Borrelia puertoricensis TaxID=2756107 RepID=UPI001FF1F050|nr:hypothetical protein [Borrelia puertoricensis]UPA18996.1 hypothetical protein bpuSUM_001537 [Borrelia puertoricensis]
MRNFGIIVLFLSTLTLSCKVYDTGSTSYWFTTDDGFVQGTKNFVDSPLRRLDRVGQEVLAGGKEIEKVVSRNLGDAVGQKKDTADAKNGVAVARESGSVLQEAGNAIEGDVDSSGEGIKNDVTKNSEGVDGQVAVGIANNEDNSGQEAGKVSQSLVDTGAQSVVNTSRLDSNLGVVSKGGMSTNHVTEYVTENINSIISTSSGLNTALQIAETSTGASGYEGEVTTNTQDSTFVETGTQESKTQRSDFSNQDVRDKILGSVVSGVVEDVVEGVMSGIDNVIEGTGTFATDAVQGVGTVIDVIKDVGTFVISDIQKMGAHMLFGAGESSSVTSEDSESVMSLSSDVTSKAKDTTVVLSSNETQVIERLEKYLQSAIKINGMSDFDQSKLESGHKKFFEWLKTSDIDASKRKELVQDLQKVFDLIKEKSSDSTELKNWVEIIVDKIENKSTIVDINSDDKLDSDDEVDFLIETTLGSRDYSGFAVSLLFQSLADTLYDMENRRDKSEEQIFQDLRKVFSDKSEGEFKSRIEAIN